MHTILKQANHCSGFTLVIEAPWIQSTILSSKGHVAGLDGNVNYWGTIPGYMYMGALNVLHNEYAIYKYHTK
jgi:hypothetical protein